MSKKMLCETCINARIEQKLIERYNDYDVLISRRTETFYWCRYVPSGWIPHEHLVVKLILECTHYNNCHLFPEVKSCLRKQKQNHMQ